MSFDQGPIPTEGDETISCAHVLDRNPQVAKNALLALADLWRGLGDTLDPELPMVCPGLVKKLADKVEFLAEAAREVSERKEVFAERRQQMIQTCAFSISSV